MRSRAGVSGHGGGSQTSTGGEAAGGGVMEVDEAPPGHLAYKKIQFVNIGRISQGARPHC